MNFKEQSSGRDAGMAKGVSNCQARASKANAQTNVGKRIDVLGCGAAAATAAS